MYCGVEKMEETCVGDFSSSCSIIPQDSNDRKFLKSLMKLCKDMVCEIDRVKPHTLGCLRSLGQVESFELIHRDIGTYLNKNLF